MEYICPILGRSTTVDPTGFYRDSWSLVRCRETGFVFLANPPDYEQLEGEYAWEQTLAAERKRRQTEEPFVSGISVFTRTVKTRILPIRNKVVSLTFSIAKSMKRSEPLHILDIGCGEGKLMVAVHHQLREIGREVVLYGIEVSKCLTARSSERVAAIGGTVISTNAIDGTSAFESGSIHVAMMSSFLEHECRPLCLLKRLHSILASDGAIVLKVPNFACWNRGIRGRRWCGFRFPDHVNYFTPKTLRRLAHETGFTVSRQRIWDKFPLSDSMYAVLTKRTAPIF